MIFQFPPILVIYFRCIRQQKKSSVGLGGEIKELFMGLSNRTFILQNRKINNCSLNCSHQTGKKSFLSLGKSEKRKNILCYVKSISDSMLPIVKRVLELSVIYFDMVI